MTTNSTTALELENPLWHFALKVYQQPNVEAICLELQDHSLSINRLIFSLWLATESYAFIATPEADHWQQQMSLPLRKLRYQLRQLKQNQPGLESCYKKMRSAELALEQVEIAYLYVEHSQHSRLTSNLPCKALAEKNLCEYASTVTNNSETIKNLFNQLLEYSFNEKSSGIKM